MPAAPAALLFNREAASGGKKTNGPVAVSGMRTDTAYGRARLPYPRRFAVLVTVYMQAGVIRVYPGWFWRWPVAALRLRLGAYASAA